MGVLLFALSVGSQVTYRLSCLISGGCLGHIQPEDSPPTAADLLIFNRADGPVAAPRCAAPPTNTHPTAAAVISAAAAQPYDGGANSLL